jgi:hypothetical protein
MARSKKIKVLSFAIFQGFLGTLLGLIAGIIYSFGGLIIDVLVSIGWVTCSETPGLSYGTLLAFGALIGMPIIFAIGGFILGIVEAFLYNLVGRWIGGLDLDNFIK